MQRIAAPNVKTFHGTSLTRRIGYRPIAAHPARRIANGNRRVPYNYMCAPPRPPMVRAMTAFAVCRRFSASS